MRSVPQGYSNPIRTLRMVRVAGFELPACRLSCVKGCKTQIAAKKSETFHVTSCLISICAVPRQRETEGEKNSRTSRNQGPGHAERPGFSSRLLRRSENHNRCLGPGAECAGVVAVGDASGPSFRQLQQKLGAHRSLGQRHLHPLQQLHQLR